MERGKRQVRHGALVAAAALAMAVAGCGSSSDSGSSSGGASTGGGGSQPAAKVSKFAIATPEKGNDFGWNQQAVTAAKQVSQETGVKVDIADGAGYDNIAPVLQQLADGGAKVIIAQASGYNTAAPDVAAQTGIPTLVWDNPKASAPGVAADAETASQEGAYLAGVLAAKTSKSKTLGIVISADDVNWNKQSGGFVAGARSVDPQIKIRLAQIGQAGYADTAGGKRVTQTVIADGADVIFGMGDGSSFGMLQAVEQAGGKVKFIDVIGDKSSIDKKHVLLSSVLWNFAPTFKKVIEDVGNGSYGKQNYELNLGNDGISLLKTDLIPADVWSQVEETKQKIIDGSVKVPLTTKKAEVQALINNG